MSQACFKWNPLHLDLSQPQWKRLLHKLDMLYHQCSMPLLENVQVLLAEVLEVRGSPLLEPELWAVLCQSIEAIQDLLLRGQANKTKGLSVFITPSTLMCCANGRVCFDTSSVPKNVLQNTPFQAPEVFQLTEPTDEDVEKMLIYSLGQTLRHASMYLVDESQGPQLSPTLAAVLRAMAQPERDARVNLLTALQLVSQHAHRYIQEKPYSYYIANLHKEVLGSLPEMDILNRVEKDIAKESKGVGPGESEIVSHNLWLPSTKDAENDSQPLYSKCNNDGKCYCASQIWGADDDDLSKCTYGRRLEYRPPRPKQTSHPVAGLHAAVPKVVSEKLTPRERWKWAFSKLTRNEFRTAATRKDISPLPTNNETVTEVFANARTQASVFSVYHELRERKMQMEELRRDIDLPVTSRSSSHENLNVNEAQDKPRSRSMMLMNVVKQLRKTKPSTKNIKNDSCNTLPENTSKQVLKSSVGKSESCRSKNFQHSSSDKPPSTKPRSNSLSQPSFGAPLRHVEDHPGSHHLYLGSHEKTKTMMGPEFVIFSYKPNISISLVTTKTKEKGGGKSVWKQVVVVLLNGQRLEVTCDTYTTRAKHIFQAVVEYQNLTRKFLFGLACAKDGEFLFLESEQKLSKIAPIGWKEGNSKAGQPVIDCFTVYFRVKFYLDVNLIRNQASKHLQYLQLRRDILEERTHCSAETALKLGGLALQAEFGDYSAEMLGKEYFLLDHYLPQNVISCIGDQNLRDELLTLHVSHNGVSKDLAQLEFISEVQQLSEYGFHFHVAEQGKKAQSRAVWLGISIAGVFVFQGLQAEAGGKKIVQQYLWKDVKRMSFDRRHFYLTPHLENSRGRYVKYKFYLSENKGCYAFHLAASHHRLYMMLQCHSKASEISFDDYAVKHGAENDSWQAEGILGEDEVGYEFNSDHVRSSHGQAVVRRASTRSWVTPCADDVLLQQDTDRAFNVCALEMQCRSSFKKENNINACNASLLSDTSFSSADIVENEETQTDEAYVIDASIRTERGSEQSFFNDETISDSLAERFANLEDCPQRFLVYVSLSKEGHSGYGLTLCSGSDLGVYVQSVFTNSPAALSGILKPGDRICAVNGKAIDGLEYHDVVDLIRNSTNKLQLLVSQLPQHDLSTICEEDASCHETTINTDAKKDDVVVGNDTNYVDSCEVPNLACVPRMEFTEELPSCSLQLEGSTVDMREAHHCSINLEANQHEEIDRLNCSADTNHVDGRPESLCVDTVNRDADGFLMPPPPRPLPAVRRKRSIKNMPAPSPPKPPRKCNLLKNKTNSLLASTVEPSESQLINNAQLCKVTSVTPEISVPPSESPSSLKYRPPKPPRRSLMAGAKGKAPDVPPRGDNTSSSRSESISSCGSMCSENELKRTADSTCTSDSKRFQNYPGSCVPLNQVDPANNPTNSLESAPHIRCCDIPISVRTACYKSASFSEKTSYPFSSLILDQPKNNNNNNNNNNNVFNYSCKQEEKKGLRATRRNDVDNACVSKLAINTDVCDNSSDSVCSREPPTMTNYCNEDNIILKIATTRTTQPVAINRKVIDSVAANPSSLLPPCCSPDCNPEECEILKYEKYVTAKFGSSSVGVRGDPNFPFNFNHRRTAIAVASKNLSISTSRPELKDESVIPDPKALSAEHSCASKFSSSSEILPSSRQNNSSSSNNSLQVKRRFSSASDIRTSSRIVESFDSCSSSSSLSRAGSSKCKSKISKGGGRVASTFSRLPDKVLEEVKRRFSLNPGVKGVKVAAAVTSENAGCEDWKVVAKMNGNFATAENSSSSRVGGKDAEFQTNRRYSSTQELKATTSFDCSASQNGRNNNNERQKAKLKGDKDVSKGVSSRLRQNKDFENNKQRHSSDPEETNATLDETPRRKEEIRNKANENRMESESHHLTIPKDRDLETNQNRRSSDAEYNKSTPHFESSSSASEETLNHKPHKKSDGDDKNRKLKTSSENPKTQTQTQTQTQTEDPKPPEIKPRYSLLRGFKLNGSRCCGDVDEDANNSLNLEVRRRLVPADKTYLSQTDIPSGVAPLSDGRRPQAHVCVNNSDSPATMMMTSGSENLEGLHVRSRRLASASDDTMDHQSLGLKNQLDISPAPDACVAEALPLSDGDVSALERDSQCVRSIKPGEIFHVVLEKTRGSLGLHIGGGCAEPSDPDGPILVKNIVVGGAADVDGRLRVGDVILEVSGTNLVGATHHKAVDVLRSCPQLAHLTVQRGGPTAVVRVHSPAIENHGPRTAWQQPRTVALPSPTLGSLREEGRPEANEMGAVAAAMRCSEFAVKSCSSPSPRKNGSDFNHSSPTRVLQNVILCSPTNEKGGSTPWTLPRSYSNGRGDFNRDIMDVEKASNGMNLSPADENPYKTTIRVSPRKNSSPSLPLLAEDHNVVARPRRNSADAWATKVVVSNNVPDIIRLHVSFANKNAVNANSQNCYQLQNGGHYQTDGQFQSSGDYQNVELQRQISSSSDCSQRMDNTVRLGRTVSPSISCSSKFSSSCSSLNDETMSSSRSPTPQLASASSERRLSAGIGYLANKNVSCDSGCHSDRFVSSSINTVDSLSATHCDIFDDTQSCQRLVSPFPGNDSINCTEDLPTVFTTNKANRNEQKNERRNSVSLSASERDPLATSTATKPKAAVLRLNSMSRSGSHLHERRRRSSSCAPSSSGVDISVSQYETETNANQEESDEESWETLLLDEFPFISEDNIFEVCLEKNSRGLGLSVCGGWDSAPADPFARLIRVKRLYPLQPAADSGLLQIGDILLTVNGIPLTGRMYFEAIEILRMAPAEVYLFVCRPEPGILPPIPQNTSLSGSGMLSSSSMDMTDTSSSRYTGPIYTELDVTLIKVGGSLGFSLVKVDSPDGEESEGGHYIKALVKEPALSDGRLQPGDKIILVNGTDISDMSHAEAIRFLRELPDEVTLCLWRESSSCPLSPLSPLSPTSPHPDDSNRKRRPKPLLRKEALDMLSDKARQKAVGPPSTGSPRSSPRIKVPKPSGDETPAPVHAPTLSRGGNNVILLPSANTTTTSTTARNYSQGGDRHFVNDDGDVEDDADSVDDGFDSRALRPSPSPPATPASSSEDHIELRFADDTPGSNSSDGLQSGQDFRIRHKPKRFHSEPVSVPSSRIPASGPGDLPFTAGSFSCSESSSSSRPVPSPARPSFLDLTPGNLSPRKQMYGRGVVVATHRVVPPVSSSAATTSSPSAVLTDDSDSSLRYLDSGGESILATDDQLTTVTSSEDSPLAITLGNSALLKWRGATLASQENLSCDEPKPDNSSQLQEQSTKSSVMTVELDRGWNSRLGFSVVAVDTEEASGVFIKVVYPNSVAEGQLQAGDKLLKVNEDSVTGLSAGDVILLLRKSSGRITLVIERYPDNFENSVPEKPKEPANTTSGLSENSVSLTRSQSQHEELLSNEVSSLNAKNNNLTRGFRWETRPSLQDENENFAGRSNHRVNM